MVKLLGLLAVLVITISGCAFFQSQAPLPPLRTCQETPPCCDEFHEPYLKVAQQVPGFGGLFVDEQDNSILYVYLTNLSQKEAVEKAIREIFGPRWMELHKYPREIRVLQGQYTYVQLKEWNDCLINIHVIPGVTSTGIDMSENRLRIGLDKHEMKRKVVEAVEAALERLGIPREAVILEFEEPAVPK